MVYNKGQLCTFREDEGMDESRSIAQLDFSRKI